MTKLFSHKNGQAHLWMEIDYHAKLTKQQEAERLGWRSWMVKQNHLVAEQEVGRHILKWPVKVPTSNEACRFEDGKTRCTCRLETGTKEVALVEVTTFFAGTDVVGPWRTTSIFNDVQGTGHVVSESYDSLEAARLGHTAAVQAAEAYAAGRSEETG